MNRWTVKQKILGVATLALLALAGASAVQTMRLDAASTQLEYLFRLDFANGDRVNLLDGLFTRIDVDALRMSAGVDPVVLQQWRGESLEQFVQIDGLMAELAANAEGASRPAIAELRAAYEKMRAGLARQFQFVAGHDAERAGEVNRREVTGSAKAIFTDLQALRTQFDARARERMDAQASAAAGAHFVALGGLLLAGAAGIVLVVVAVRRLSARWKDRRHERVAGVVADGARVVLAPLPIAALAAAFEVACAAGQLREILDGPAAGRDKAGALVRIIDDVERQARILALNAEAEAVRAGDLDRGFAIVAEEARRLARRCAEAKAQVQALVVGGAKAGDDPRRADDPGRAMDDVARRVKRVSEMIAGICAAAGEQAVIGQAGEAATQLERVTRQNIGLVRQSASAAESLRQQAMLLGEAARSFGLPGIAASPEPASTDDGRAAAARVRRRAPRSGSWSPP